MRYNNSYYLDYYVVFNIKTFILRSINERESVHATMNIMLRTYLTLRGHILLDILRRHMYKVVNGHLQCRHTYICLPAIVRVSEPLNVLLPLLCSIYRYRSTTIWKRC